MSVNLINFCGKFIIMSLYINMYQIQILQLIMRSNQNWFESPFPKSSAFFHPSAIRPEQEREEDDFQQIKSMYISPQPIPPIFRGSHTLNPLSPWSKLINPQPQNKQSQIQIPRLIEDNEAIDRELIFSDHQDSEQEHITPIRNDQKGKDGMEEGELHTTGRKSQFEPTVKKSRPRQKGLRRLSQRAYEIVQEMRNATYKQVACKLVQELNEQQFEGDNKEQQNIKRRVYDALNVLIALGVLKKDGRRIVSQRSKRGRKSESFQQAQTQALKIKLLGKMKMVQQKKRKLSLTKKKHLSITSLLQRNKENNFKKQSIITFPFIGLFINRKDIENVKHSRSDQILVKSNQPLQPFGDIDSIKWLGESLKQLSLQEKLFQPFSIKQEQQDQSS